MKYVTVGFKITEENSIHYGKATDLETFHKDINTAIEKGADFISLRIIKGNQQPSTTDTTQKTIDNNQQPSTTQERKYYCNNPECKKEIDKAVVGFCLNNKDRFKGKVYCRECQEGY